MPDGSVNEEEAPSAVVTPFPLTSAANDPSPAKRRGRDRRDLPPPVNIRLSVPILKSRFHVAVVAGRERRSRERLAVERRRNPLATKFNVLFVVIGALALYATTLGAIMAWGALTGT